MTTGNVQINGKSVNTIEEVMAIVTPDVFRINDSADECAYERDFFLTAVQDGISGDFHTFTEEEWKREIELAVSE